jgi:hypothetical protein
MRRLCNYFYNVLDPAEWWGALLFGLIMAMIVTTGYRAYIDDGDGAAGEMRWAVLGGNLAWGIIQGWLHVNDAVFERSRIARLVREATVSPDEVQAVESIRDEHDPDLADTVSGEERARLYLHMLGNMKAGYEPKTGARRADLAGALVIFVLVSLTAIPAVVAFSSIGDLKTAVRVSNLCLLILLFGVGSRWAHTVTDMNRWVGGFSIMVFGLIMAIIGELLGG